MKILNKSHIEIFDCKIKKIVFKKNNIVCCKLAILIIMVILVSLFSNITSFYSGRKLQGELKASLLLKTTNY